MSQTFYRVKETGHWKPCFIVSEKQVENQVFTNIVWFGDPTNGEQLVNFVENVPVGEEQGCVMEHVALPSPVAEKPVETVEKTEKVEN